MILETPRTYLHPFQPSDFEALRRLHFDPEVMRYLIGGVRRTDDDVRRDLSIYIDHQHEHGFSKWAVLDRETGALIGRAGFVIISETSELDLGYALARSHWGRGIASELASALVVWAREHVPQFPLVGLVQPGNVASARVLEKVGFRLREHAVYFATLMHVYSLDDPDGSPKPAREHGLNRKTT